MSRSHTYRRARRENLIGARSPYVDAALFPSTASRVLGFAERCAAAVTAPQLLG